MARVDLKAILLTCAIFSAPLANAAKKLSISDIRKNIRYHNRSLNKINSRIIGLEGKLSRKNKDYILILDSKREIESKIFKSSEKISQYIDLVNEEKNKTKKVLGSVVVNSITTNETSADILSKKILSEFLSKKLLKLQSLENILKIKKNKLDDMNTKFMSLENKEREILTFISELENRKKEYANQYVNTEKRKLELSGKLSSIKSKISQKSNKKRKPSKPSLGIQFSSPISDYSGVEYQKKGITFKFKEKQPVKNVRSGVINHVGTLANYGNVVMIDHGKGIRTIFLGDFSSKVKQGQKIKANQIIGYTNKKNNGRDLGQIYFEVRKKNKAQNTLLLMDKKFLAKNNLDSVNI
jgi:murein DD-endopeptidase MepM/ murein hydrolase activator NlpD